MKKKLIGLIVLLAVIGLGVGGYFILRDEETSSFTSAEQRWLDTNKNDVVNIYLPRNIAAFTYMGKGVFFDFIDYLETRTELSFKEYSYDDSQDKEYVIELVDFLNDNQVPIFSDSYVILTKEKTDYAAPEEIEGFTLGVLASDQENASKYLENASIEYVTFETEEAMLEDFQKEDTTLNGILGLKSLYLDEILTYDYHIGYHLLDMTKTYALTLNGDTTLNDIVKKTFETWKHDFFEESYRTQLLNTYFEFKEITEKEKIKLREKTYVYAFSESGIYDRLLSGNLKGMNYHLIKSFAEFANIDMEYEKSYKSKKDLVEAFQSDQVDFFFHDYSGEMKKVHYTGTPISSNIVILSSIRENVPISSLASLSNYKVSTVKNSKIEQYLLDNGISVSSYDSMNELLKNKKDSSIIAMNLEDYEYFHARDLSKFKISYVFPNKIHYGYAIQEKDELFAALFDFYLEYMPVQTLVKDSYQDIYRVDNREGYYLIAIAVLAFLVVVQLFYNIKRIIIFFKNKKRKKLTKNEKIRYVDALTSLKNRSYLNDNIEKWDNSEVYPQIIIIVDLNNIAYINDNFGHEEGDKVITEAANILIQTQMPRSEIIRTDGNEFLIYLVQYEEKQATAYIRKLNKEFKELSHGFGAAIGYSIINDAIKTIDDAVNEATLDMRTNKEAMMEEEK